MKRTVPLVAAMAVASLASLAALLALSAGPARGDVVLPSGFSQSPVAGGLTGPTDMEFAPDGRLFVTEEAGKVRIVQPDGTLATFLNISSKVASDGERSLAALTFDPNFSANHYVYLHYTREATATSSVHNRVVRVTANDDATKAVAGSEELILRLNNQDSDSHMGGSIDFGANNKLFVAVGDNVGGAKSQELTTLFGKLLRINKDGTIPTNNPFYATATGKNRAIWALGLRNPFKFAVQPGTNAIFINDVGADDFEEVNESDKGANFGWPDQEGPESDDDGYTPPIFAYEHEGDPDTTGCAVTGGAFYNPATAQFPSEYVGDYFFADLCGGWIRTLDPSSGEASGFATGVEAPVDLEVDGDGSLHFLTRGATPSVDKIEYTGN